jgi:hypothetical protein
MGLLIYYHVTHPNTLLKGYYFRDVKRIKNPMKKILDGGRG